MPQAAAVVTAIAAVASTAISIRSANQQKRAAANAAAERREQNAISQASGENRAAVERRRAIREERVRRARILQSAETGGAGASSGAIGATGILSTNLGTAIGQSNAQTAASRGISASNDRLTNIQAGAIRNSAQNQIFSSIAAGLGQVAGSFGGFSGATGAGASAPLAQQQATGVFQNQNRAAGITGRSVFGL